MTALQERAIHLVKRMSDERLSGALRFLQSMEDGVPCAKAGEEATLSPDAPSIDDDRRRRLIALFGSIADETFREHPDLPLALNSERAAL